MGAETDTGPKAGVEAVRHLTGTGDTVPFVHVVGEWATVQWYAGPGAGFNLFHKSASGWIRVIGGGGTFGVADAQKLGVPQSAWCALGVPGAKCGP